MRLTPFIALLMAVPLMGAAVVSCGDAPSCEAIDGGSAPRGLLGTISRGGECVGCNGFDDPDQADEDCQTEYGARIACGCRAYCKDYACMKYCPDDCAPDAVAGCTPGDGTCTADPFNLRVCDPTCAPAGACRQCIDDADCQREIGPDGRCARHCGTCCDIVTGAGCGCI